ncbi:MAG TPA: zinc-binding dehydrogenase [Thermodesulfobacteriota bacterium]|nr:zinc-binding dehydrogenase [Thermodesulfobacteriota bacterium]
MKAVIFHGIRDLRVQEVADPRPGPREAKIRIKYCGICGSDLHEYVHGLFPLSSFGHEACGEVVEVGREVKEFEAGDQVIAIQKGAYAECLVCPQERMIKKPRNMSWERAAVVEPLSGAAYAIEKGGVQSSDTVLVAGAGPVGLMVLLGLKAIGVEEIFVTDISERRRKKAEELGATLVLNPEAEKISVRIKELSAGRGVDVAVEAVGIEATLKDCLASVRFQGKVIVQGIFTDRVPIHMLGFVTRETTMIGTNSANPALAMSWIESKGIRPELIITKIIRLEQISAEGFEVLTKREKEEIKILVAP